MYHVLDKINYIDIVKEDDRYKIKDSSCILSNYVYFRMAI